MGAFCHFGGEHAIRFSLVILNSSVTDAGKFPNALRVLLHWSIMYLFQFS